MTTRNPYLLLGVDFGTHRDEARRRFALAARRLRRDPAGAVTVEDLTWALHEIESLDEHPEHLVHVFRVPADPTVFTPAGEGLFRPPAVSIPRRTTPDDPAELERLRRAAGAELIDHLLAAFAASTRIDLAYETPEGPST